MIPFEFGVWNLGLCLFLGISILILYQHMGASGITSESANLSFMLWGILGGYWD